MKKILINFFAVLLALLAGSVLNGALLVLGTKLIPPPEGVNIMDADSLAAGIGLFEPYHFISPFVAHAMGTFLGAIVAVILAVGRPTWPAWVIGGLFFVGGVVNAFLIPAPTWFIVVDLALAYFPMAWLAIRIVNRPQA